MKMRYLLLGYLISIGFVPAYAEIASVDYVQSVLPTQAQADWDQDTTTAADYIKNKPTLGAMAAKDSVALTDLASGVQTSLGKADTAVQPGDNVSDLVNDAGYLTSHQTLTDMGITATVTELNYTDGVTSNIQTQIDNKVTKTNTASQVYSTNASGEQSSLPWSVSVVNNSVPVRTADGQLAVKQTPSANTDATSKKYVDDGLSAKANSADLATVATSGSYNDLTNKPTIPAAQVQSDWNASSGMGEILNKPTLSTVATTGAYSDLSGTPTLATVATSGSYNDLSNKPSIPANAADVGAVAATQATKGGILTTNATSGDVEVSASIAASKVSGLATVATSGSYNDLENKPTIPAAQVQSDWNAVSGVSAIANKPTLSTVATTGAYSDLSGTPTLATVATSGSYNDLSNKPSIPAAQVQSDWNAVSGVSAIANKPTLSTVATTGAYSDLSGTPTLATVATSGSYNDLSNKPSIPAAQVQSDWNAVSGVSAIANKPTLSTVATTGAYSDLSGTPTLATVATSGSYNDLSNKPSIPANAADVGAVAATQATKGGILTTNATSGDVEVSASIAASKVSGLATVATSGSYNDLENKPTIPDAQVQADWDQTTTTAVDYIKNKPTIPTVNDATLTIQKNGTSVGTFTANASSNETINITVPTTAADVSAVPTTRTVNNKALSQDIALGGADVALTGYAKASSESAVAATDTVNEAIGKLEKALDGKQSSGSYVPTTTTVNGSALSSNVTLGGADIATTGYTKASTAAAITAGDSVNVALGKLEKSLDGYVPTTTTVNSHALSSDVTLVGSDIALTGYTQAATASAVAATDTVNQAIGKLEKSILPVGTTSGTVAAGDDARFDSIATSQPSGTAPTGRVWVWVGSDNGGGS